MVGVNNEGFDFNPEEGVNVVNDDNDNQAQGVLFREAQRSLVARDDFSSEPNIFYNRRSVVFQYIENKFEGVQFIHINLDTRSIYLGFPKYKQEVELKLLDHNIEISERTARERTVNVELVNLRENPYNFFVANFYNQEATFKMIGDRVIKAFNCKTVIQPYIHTEMSNNISRYKFIVVNKNKAKLRVESVDKKAVKHYAKAIGRIYIKGI